jgi:hypothetical protein
MRADGFTADLIDAAKTMQSIRFVTMASSLSMSVAVYDLRGSAFQANAHLSAAMACPTAALAAGVSASAFSMTKS